MINNYIGDFTKPMFMPTISFEFHTALSTLHSHWGSYLTSLTPLIILQKYFFSQVSNSHSRKHTDVLFKEYKVLPLRNLYMFKVLNKLNRSRTKRRAVRYQTLTLRGYLNVPVPKSNLTLFKKYHSYIASTFYNIVFQVIWNLSNPKINL